MRRAERTLIFGGENQPTVVDDYQDDEGISRGNPRRDAQPKKDDAQAKAIELNLQRLSDFLDIEESDQRFLKGAYAPKVPPPVLSSNAVTWLYTLAALMFWLGLYAPVWLLSMFMATALFLACCMSLLYRQSMKNAQAAATTAAAVARYDLQASTKAYHEKVLHEVRAALRQAPKKEKTKDSRPPQGGDD